MAKLLQGCFEPTRLSSPGKHHGGWRRYGHQNGRHHFWRSQRSHLQKQTAARLHGLMEYVRTQWKPRNKNTLYPKTHTTRNIVKKHRPRIVEYWNHHQAAYEGKSMGLQQLEYHTASPHQRRLQSQINSVFWRQSAPGTSWFKGRKLMQRQHFTWGQFWPLGIVVACVCMPVCVSVCVSITCMSAW